MFATMRIWTRRKYYSTHEEKWAKTLNGSSRTSKTGGDWLTRNAVECPSFECSTIKVHQHRIERQLPLHTLPWWHSTSVAVVSICPPTRAYKSSEEKKNTHNIWTNEKAGKMPGYIHRFFPLSAAWRFFSLSALLWPISTPRSIHSERKWRKKRNFMINWRERWKKEHSTCTHTWKHQIT